MSRSMLGGLLAAVAIALSAGAVSAQDLPDVNLKVSGGNRTQNMFKFIQEPFFTKQITEDSNGAVTTTFGSLDDLGLQGPEVLRLLQLGMFDISEGTLSYMAGEDAHFDALDLPGLTADIDMQRKVADAYRPTLAKILEDKFKVKLLSMSPIALQVIYCKGDIKGLADLKGKKVRTYNRGMSDLVEAAGAAAVNIPFAEVVPAMQRGVADCAVTATSAGNTARWWEVTDSLVKVPMGWATTFFAANLANWNRLDPKVQAFLTDEFAKMEDRQWKQAAADIQDGINCNTGMGECKNGIPADKKMTLVELSDADQALAKKLVEGVLKGWASRCGADCAKDWNAKVGTLLGVDAPVE
ncbi:TRAP transporter substrate-binding protein [Jiella sonneratiae]|uniref:TRAP transporter substrate-binding protein n=1 Tax=Jiella sonneratiae TaxID=2816856 RepID=A0ABS3JAD3_9HYPH|nr:TRAP transporter substrate-binding protein [Jiella sonneratiae]MBO0906097.1 TRAP transporter substrate-binding protein [Jiella sonneratiae]